MAGGIAQATTVHAPSGMVATADHLASSAGVAALRAGGDAADAAVAAGAVLAVTNQHQCGMGGDLFALVHDPAGEVTAVCAAGRAGSGADALQARIEGLDRLPRHHDIRAVTVPGCVDGWLELHRRYGRLPLGQVLDAAVTYAATGFPVSRLLAATAPAILGLDGGDDYHDPAMALGGKLPAGTVIRRPGVAAALEAIVAEGRAGFYQGVFGDGLLRLGGNLFTRGDLARSQADWVEPLRVRVWGHDLYTPPPPSQGYLTLAAAWVAAGLDLPDDPYDAAWAHLLAESARAVGLDRDAVLFEGADGPGLLAEQRLAAQRATIDPARRGAGPPLAAVGGTTVCCAVDRDRMGVTLIQSNASGWGAHIVEPETGIFLHDRGLGFSLADDHPAAFAPGARPPHTLAPALVTRPDGSLRAVLGTMGGDTQPQVLLQLLARLLHHDQPPGAAVDAGRFMLGDGDFDTWAGDGPGHVRIEAHTPGTWETGLTDRGHDVRRSRHEIDHAFGHAQVIEAVDGVLAGVADPRALDGAASGY
ncbi:MAG TPA: gamma-glutamyltransferase [Acidimicrobiales bacterium]|nr:gamma-glutamyltransferase [Acidimicrobiales bacterium]